MPTSFVAVAHAHARARRTLRHRRGLPIDCLVAIDLPAALTPLPAAQTRESVTPTSGMKSRYLKGIYAR